jgi:hypothetical protein
MVMPPGVRYRGGGAASESVGSYTGSEEPCAGLEGGVGGLTGTVTSSTRMQQQKAPLNQRLKRVQRVGGGSFTLEPLVGLEGAS